MAYSDDFKKQVQDWLSSQQTNLQTQISTAKTLANNAASQNNSGMAQTWGAAASRYQSQLNALSQNSQEVLGKLQTADWGSENMAAVQAAMQGDSISLEKLNEAYSGGQQLADQNKQLTDFQTQLTQQDLGVSGLNGLNLGEALGSTAGNIGQLNQFLGNQEAQTFNQQLKPLIQMALGSQGLSDSGANVELQSKALAQLEQTRQQNMMQAALGDVNQIQGLQYNQIQGGIGAAQNMMNNQFDLNRTSITMQYQAQLEQQREQLALELSKYQGGGSGGAGMGSLIGAGVGALGFIGGPQMGLATMGLGAQLGGTIGGMASPGSGQYAGQNPGMGLGSTFFAGSQMMPKSWGSSPTPSPAQINGPTLGQYSGGQPTGPWRPI